jgi:hypothetical protein
LWLAVALSLHRLRRQFLNLAASSQNLLECEVSVLQTRVRLLRSFDMIFNVPLNNCKHPVVKTSHNSFPRPERCMMIPNTWIILYSAKKFTVQWICFLKGRNQWLLALLDSRALPLPQTTILHQRVKCRDSVFNPLNAELNSICHLPVLLGDLTFMGPCTVSIFQYACISNKMEIYTVYLYLETALHVSGGTLHIIRSAYNCIYSIWYLSHRYCYLPLS